MALQCCWGNDTEIEVRSRGEGGSRGGINYFSVVVTKATTEKGFKMG